MLGRSGVLLLGLSGAWSIAAGCAASGSNGQINGPMYDFDEAGSDGGAGIESGAADDAGGTVPHDASPPADATNVTSPMDATPDDSADGSDASNTVTADAADAGCTSTTAILGGSASTLFAVTSVGTGSFVSASPTGSSTTAPALVAFGGGFQALVTEGGDAGGGNAIFATAFSGGSWSAPTALGGSADALGPAAIAVVGTTLQAAYLNPEHFYFQATYSAAWNAGTAPVQPSDGGTTQAFGPVNAAAAGTATQLVIAYEGNNLLPYAQTWTSGAGWDDGVALGSAKVMVGTPLAITALGSGGSGDMLVVYTDGEGSGQPNNLHLMYVVRTAGGASWSTPAQVNSNAYATGQTNGAAAPSLTAMSGGRALVVWQGYNQGVANGVGGSMYGSVYTPGATPVWSTPLEMSAATPSSPPSLAQGVCGDDAVAAYVTGAEVYTTHFAGGAWTTPVSLPAGAGASSVSIATSP